MMQEDSRGARTIMERNGASECRCMNWHRDQGPSKHDSSRPSLCLGPTIDSRCPYQPMRSSHAPSPQAVPAVAANIQQPSISRSDLDSLPLPSSSSKQEGRYSQRPPFKVVSFLTTNHHFLTHRPTRCLGISTVAFTAINQADIARTSSGK